FRYVDERGGNGLDANPNGSLNDIAGVINEAGNVLGLMPHPDRAMHEALGSADGRGIFEALVEIAA
ncbi:MAG: phosphoribosylformylglycinamidine synthase subunit PurQ, partial [Gemmatimonadota bacterium]